MRAIGSSCGPRLIGLLLAAVSAGALSACGSGDAAKPPPGSPENPLVAEAPSGGGSSESGASPGRAGFKELVDDQREQPAGRDDENPCGLVTKAQARAILGVPLLDPVVAPQGPTCIYRDRAGQSFTTIAIQSLSFKRLRPRIRRLERVAVSGRTAYCGTYGRPMLYLPLSGGRVLSIAAQCETATRLARRAAPDLLS